jgi:DNA-binding phage protein
MKNRSRTEAMRNDAKIAQQSSMSKTEIVIALSASAGTTSETPSVVPG